MPRPLPRERWLAEAADRFAVLDAWRQTHPRATWSEIEAAIDGQLAPLRAHLLGDTAMASAATDRHGARPPCPACGEPLTAAGSHQRRLTTEGDHPVVLTRTYRRCSACGTGLFPPR